MLPPGITMFPEPANVFAENIDAHAKVLFPLFTVDLSVINPEWTGQLHMLQFNEDPYFQGTVASFNEYCKENMIGFDVIDGKYRFKTDFSYFDLGEDWVEWFEKTKAGFEQSRDRYRKEGKLYDGFNEPVDELEQLGGDPVWIQADETPLDPDGNPMTFIARAYSGRYASDNCEKDIYLFYSHKYQLAVLTYQIT